MSKTQPSPLIVPVHSLLQERSNLINRELIWSSGLGAGVWISVTPTSSLLWPAAGFVPGYRLWFKSSLALVRNPLFFLLTVGVLYLLSCLFYYGPEKPQRGVVNEVNMHTHWSVSMRAANELSKYGKWNNIVATILGHNVTAHCDKGSMKRYTI